MAESQEQAEKPKSPRKNPWPKKRPSYYDMSMPYSSPESPEDSVTPRKKSRRLLEKEKRAECPAGQSEKSSTRKTSNTQDETKKVPNMVGSKPKKQGKKKSRKKKIAKTEIALVKESIAEMEERIAKIKRNLILNEMGAPKSSLTEKTASPSVTAADHSVMQSCSPAPDSAAVLCAVSTNDSNEVLKANNEVGIDVALEEKKQTLETPVSTSKEDTLPEPDGNDGDTNVKKQTKLSDKKQPSTKVLIPQCSVQGANIDDNQRKVLQSNGDVQHAEHSLISISRKSPDSIAVTSLIPPVSPAVEKKSPPCVSSIVEPDSAVRASAIESDQPETQTSQSSQATLTIVRLGESSIASDKAEKVTLAKSSKTSSVMEWASPEARPQQPPQSLCTTRVLRRSVEKVRRRMHFSPDRSVRSLREVLSGADAVTSEPKSTPVEKSGHKKRRSWSDGQHTKKKKKKKPATHDEVSWVDEDIVPLVDEDEDDKTHFPGANVIINSKKTSIDEFTVKRLPLQSPRGRQKKPSDNVAKPKTDDSAAGGQKSVPDSTSSPVKPEVRSSKRLALKKQKQASSSSSKRPSPKKVARKSSEPNQKRQRKALELPHTSDKESDAASKCKRNTKRKKESDNNGGEIKGSNSTPVKIAKDLDLSDKEDKACSAAAPCAVLEETDTDVTPTNKENELQSTTSDSEVQTAAQQLQELSATLMSLNKDSRTPRRASSPLALQGVTPPSVPTSSPPARAPSSSQTLRTPLKTRFRLRTPTKTPSRGCIAAGGRSPVRSPARFVGRFSPQVRKAELSFQDGDSFSVSETTKVGRVTCGAIEVLDTHVGSMDGSAESQDDVSSVSAVKPPSTSSALASFTPAPRRRPARRSSQLRRSTSKVSVLSKKGSRSSKRHGKKDLNPGFKARTPYRRKLSAEDHAPDSPSDNLEIVEDNNDEWEDEEIEERIDKHAATQNIKLTAKNVKTLIREVITNEHVLDMVRNTLMEDELKDQLKEAIFEPKITRGTIKKALEKGTVPAIWPLTPVKEPEPGVQSFTDIEFPEEEEDEDYNPVHDQEQESDADCDSVISSQASELGSPCPQFLAPSTPSNTSAAPTPVAPGRAEDTVTASEDEPPLAHRLRSKFSLTDTALEDIEASYVAPDITPDLYDAGIDDHDWQTFLSTLNRSDYTTLNDTYDEKADPEYNFLEEKEDEDIEDYRNDKGVRVTKKELNELMDELFDAYQEYLDEEDTKDDLPQNTLVGIVGEKTKAPSPSKPSRAGYKPKPPPIKVDTPASIMLLQDVKNLMKEKDGTTDADIIRETDGTASGGISPEQVLQVQDQVRKHVQLLAQAYVLSTSGSEYAAIGTKAVSFLKEIQLLGNLHKKIQGTTSVFHAINLKQALQLVESPIPQPQHDNLNLYLWEGLKKKGWKRRYGNQCEFGLTWSQAETLCSSPIFLFPQMLPETRFFERKKKPVFTIFTEAEDNLLALGISQFEELGPRTYWSQLIQTHMMPTKTIQQINLRIKRLRSKTAGVNPVKNYFENSEVPVFERYTTLEDPADIRPPNQRNADLLPSWYTVYERIKSEIKAGIIDLDILPDTRSSGCHTPCSFADLSGSDTEEQTSRASTPFQPIQSFSGNERCSSEGEVKAGPSEPVTTATCIQVVVCPSNKESMGKEASTCQQLSTDTSMSQHSPSPAGSDATPAKAKSDPPTTFKPVTTPQPLQTESHVESPSDASAPLQPVTTPSQPVKTDLTDLLSDSMAEFQPLTTTAPDQARTRSPKTFTATSAACVSATISASPQPVVWKSLLQMRTDLATSPQRLAVAALPGGTTLTTSSKSPIMQCVVVASPSDSSNHTVARSLSSTPTPVVAPVTTSSGATRKAKHAKVVKSLSFSDHKPQSTKENESNPLDNSDGRQIEASSSVTSETLSSQKTAAGISTVTDASNYDVDISTNINVPSQSVSYQECDVSSAVHVGDTSTEIDVVGPMSPQEGPCTSSENVILETRLSELKATSDSLIEAPKPTSEPADVPVLMDESKRPPTTALESVVSPAHVGVISPTAISLPGLGQSSSNLQPNSLTLHMLPAVSAVDPVLPTPSMSPVHVQSTLSTANTVLTPQAASPTPALPQPQNFVHLEANPTSEKSPSSAQSKVLSDSETLPKVHLQASPSDCASPKVGNNLSKELLSPAHMILMGGTMKGDCSSSDLDISGISEHDIIVDGCHLQLEPDQSRSFNESTEQSFDDTDTSAYIMNTPQKFIPNEECSRSPTVYSDRSFSNSPGFSDATPTKGLNTPTKSAVEIMAAFAEYIQVTPKKTSPPKQAVLCTPSPQHQQGTPKKLHSPSFRSTPMRQPVVSTTPTKFRNIIPKPGPQTPPKPVSPLLPRRQTKSPRRRILQQKVRAIVPKGFVASTFSVSPTKKAAASLTRKARSRTTFRQILPKVDNGVQQGHGPASSVAANVKCDENEDTDVDILETDFASEYDTLDSEYASEENQSADEKENSAKAAAAIANTAAADAAAATVAATETAPATTDKPVPVKAPPAPAPKAKQRRLRKKKEKKREENDSGSEEDGFSFGLRLGADSQDEGDEGDPLAQFMAASTTIRFNPKSHAAIHRQKSKSKAKLKREVTLHMLAPDLLEADVLRDERDTAFAQAYLAHVKETLKDDKDKLEAFLKILYEFGKSDKTPVELHREVQTLLASHPEVLDNFSGFLLPDQAQQCGCFVTNLEFTRARTFLRKLEVFFSKHPSHLQKILKTLASWNKSEENSSAELLERVTPLLRGQQHLVDEFTRLLVTEKPLIDHNDDFEEITIQEDEDSRDLAPPLEEGVEEVVLPEASEDALYGTSRCHCRCHAGPDRLDGRVRQHCQSCSMKIIRGKLYMQTMEKTLRPVNVKFLGKQPRPQKEVRPAADDEAGPEEEPLSSDEEGYAEAASEKRQRRPRQKRAATSQSNLKVKIPGIRRLNNHSSKNTRVIHIEAAETTEQLNITEDPVTKEPPSSSSSSTTICTTDPATTIATGETSSMTVSKDLSRSVPVDFSNLCKEILPDQTNDSRRNIHDKDTINGGTVQDSGRAEATKTGQPAPGYSEDLPSDHALAEPNPSKCKLIVETVRSSPVNSGPFMRIASKDIRMTQFISDSDNSNSQSSSSNSNVNSNCSNDTSHDGNHSSPCTKSFPPKDIVVDDEVTNMGSDSQKFPFGANNEQIILKINLGAKVGKKVPFSSVLSQETSSEGSEHSTSPKKPAEPRQDLARSLNRSPLLHDEGTMGFNVAVIPETANPTRTETLTSAVRMASKSAKFERSDKTTSLMPEISLGRLINAQPEGSAEDSRDEGPAQTKQAPVTAILTPGETPNESKEITASKQKIFKTTDTSSNISPSSVRVEDASPHCSILGQTNLNLPEVSTAVSLSTPVIVTQSDCVMHSPAGSRVDVVAASSVTATTNCLTPDVKLSKTSISPETFHTPQALGSPEAFYTPEGRNPADEKIQAPPANSVKEPSSKKVKWTREEDREILVNCKQYGSTREMFQKISETLPSHPTVHEVEERFNVLMKAYENEDESSEEEDDQ